MDKAMNNRPVQHEASGNPPLRMPALKGLSRRKAMAAAILGVAGVAGAASWLSRLFNFSDYAPADIFPGDAPKGELWEQWKRRGWVKEAYNYTKLGRNVQCKACPNNCLLQPGDRSHCRNRVNKDGTLYTLAYGNPCAMHVDPVEKKPLFHFLPGSSTFSLATSGCVFRCLNCQNWDISQKKPEETKDASGPEYRLRPPLPESLSLEQMRRLSLFPEDVVAVATALKCPSIAYTYSEPTAFYEYTLDTCVVARKAKIKNIIVTCGSIEERPLRRLLEFVDAAHVDLKGFDENIYRQLNSGRLQTILNTLKVYKSTGVWFEIINLIVPTYTDKPETIKRMCGWLVENLGPDVPLHFSRFHPQHKLTHLPPTPLAILLQARDIARAAGLRYVYIGNAREVADAETTFCPNCKKPLIERTIFAVEKFRLQNGRCPHCNTAIPGIWV